jgi:predicted ATPase
VLLVTGDVGVGKTRFAEELARRLAPDALVRGSPVPDAPELWLFTELLRDLRRRGATLDGELLELAEGRAGLATLASPQGRFAFADRLLLELTRLVPPGGTTLLLADDLHRADARTLATLETLVSRLTSAPVLLCAVYSPSPLAPAALSSFVGIVAREPSTAQARLDPFTREETGRYLEVTLGSLPSPDLVDTIHEKTRGNAQLLAALCRDPEEWAGRTAVQTTALLELDTLREAMLGYLKTLPEPAMKVLSVAAVFGGRQIDVGPVSVALGLPVPDVVAALDAGSGARVLVRTGPASYRFLYPLVRDVLHQRLPPLERAAWHGRAAEALEAQHTDAEDHLRVGEIAEHLVEACATGDAARAVAWSLRASELALAAGDAAASSRYAARGLVAVAFSASPDPASHARLRALCAKRA